MKRIIITPGGVKRNLSILLKHLNHQKNSFDEWHLWVNTENPENIAYMNKLIKTFNWIKKIEIPGSIDVERYYPLASDPNTAYLKIDDTIVYLDPTFVNTMFTARCEDTTHMLLYANIINNPIITHLHQRHGVFKYTELTTYNRMDPVGWYSSDFAQCLHATFLQSVKTGYIEKWKQSFTRWELFNNEMPEMNAIAWLGGLPGSSINSILGSAVCVQFGSIHQRTRLLETGVLDEYINLCPPLLVTVEISKLEDRENEAARLEEAVSFREEALAIKEQILAKNLATVNRREAEIAIILDRVKKLDETVTMKEQAIAQHISIISNREAEFINVVETIKKREEALTIKEQMLFQSIAIINNSDVELTL